MPRASIDRVLPHSRLLDIDGAERNLRRGRGPQVVVQGGSASERTAYMRRLASITDDLRHWGAELFGIVSDARESDATIAATWLLDAEGSPPDRSSPAGTSVLVTDEWGEVYFATAEAATGVAPADGPPAEGGPAAGLPSPEEILDWVRFVAIQCPECENPEGGWRDL